MKTRIPGLLFAIAFLGLLSCQNDRSTSSSTSEDIPLALRLTAESGNAIPEADTLRFVVAIGSKTVDTLVAWSAHELDLGSVKDGDQIKWQATGWKWDSTKTVRRVVWASKLLEAVAHSSGNTLAFTLETPVKDSTFAPPKLTPEGFAVEGSGKVSRPYSDSVFVFSFKSSGGIDTVRIDDSLVQAKDGVYSREYRLTEGWDRVVKVVLRDRMGSIAIFVFTVSRAPAPVVVDSSLDVSFEVPADTTLSYADSNLSVRIKTSSKLHIDTVRVGTTRLSKDAGDSTLWTGRIDGIAVGKDTLRAIAIAGAKRDTAKRVLERLKKDVIDSTLNVAFETAADTIISNVDTSLSVRVRTTSKLHIDTVRVGSTRLSKDGVDSTLWMGRIDGIAVGKDTLRAIAVAGTRRDTAKRVVERLKRDVIDSAVNVAFETPADTTVSYADSNLSVRVRSTSKLRVDTVWVNATRLSQDGGDSTLWTGRIDGLAVGKDTLRAILVAGVKRDTAKRIVERLKKDVVDSTVAVAFETPADTTISYADSNLSVRVRTASKLRIDTVRVGSTRLSQDKGDTTLWTGRIDGLSVGKDTLRAIAVAGTKRDTAKRVVERLKKEVVDSTITVKFRKPSARYVTFADSFLQVEVEAVSKQRVLSVLVGKDSLKPSTLNDSLWVGLVHGIKVGDNSLTAIATTSLRKDSASFVATRAQDSSITTSFIEPDGDTILPNNATSLAVKVKVITKLPVSSVLVLGKDSLKRSGENDSVWNGTVKDLVEGENPLVFVVAAGMKTDTVRKTVNRAGDSTISVVFVSPTKDMEIPHSSSSVQVTVQVTTKLNVTSVKIGTAALTWDGAGSEIWRVNLTDLKVGSDTLRVVATAGTKTGTAQRIVTRRDSIGAPTFSPPAGTYVGTQMVVLKAASGANIRCKLENVAWKSCMETLTISRSQTIYASAYKDGTDTSMSSAEYVIATPPPTFGAAAGTHLDSVRVAIKPGVAGAVTKWSTDKSTWTPIAVGDSVTLHKTDSLFAWDSLEGMARSPVAGARYEVTATKPVINPRGGIFTGSKSVTISTTTSDATIEYSTDKSTWKTYTTALSIDNNATLWARTAKPGLTTSAMDSGEFKIAVTSPVFKLAGNASNGGDFNTMTSVSVLSTQIGAVVSWSTNGTTWNTSPTTFTIDTTTTLWAKATMSGLEPSATVKVTFRDTAFGYKMKNSPRPSSGCGKTTAVTSGTYAMSVGATNRTYVLKLPTGYDANKPHRLVFGMHYMGGSAATIASGNWYNLVQQDSGYSTIWVAPQGAANGTWGTSNDQDIVYFDSLLVKLKSDVCVDTSRVFVVGFSFGAMYTHSLARSRQNVIRGAVVYAPGEVNIYNPPEVSSPVAWMGMVGMSDATIPATYGRKARNRIVNYNGGDSSYVAPEITAGSKSHLCYDYTVSKQRQPVKWCTFDGGHMFDPADGSTSSAGVNSWVPAETWKFITQF